MDSNIILYLKKIIETKKFGELTDYTLITQLLKDKYTDRLLRNFYNFFKVEIPQDFIVSISDDPDLINKISKIPNIHNEGYFKERPLTIGIDELYDEYHFLNETKTSKNLYYINIINFSVFCVRYKSIQSNYDSAININLLLENILICVIRALETFNYNDILILYKTYLSLPYNIYDTRKGNIFGGNPDPINLLVNPYDTAAVNYPNQKQRGRYIEKIKELLDLKIFYYFSFNTVNEIQFSLFEFTNILLVTVNESKNIHDELLGMSWNLTHESGHHREKRCEKISLIESYRLYKLLKVIHDNPKYSKLKIFPWLLSNEYYLYLTDTSKIDDKVIYISQNMENRKDNFNLYHLKILVYYYDEQYKNKTSEEMKDNLFITKYLNNDLLNLLEELHIITIDDNYRKLMSDDLLVRLCNQEEIVKNYEELFNITNEIWKYGCSSYSNLINNNKYIIENIDITSDLYLMLTKDKNDAIERARLRYINRNTQPTNKIKYFKYKKKYLRLKKYS